MGILDRCISVSRRSRQVGDFLASHILSQPRGATCAPSKALQREKRDVLNSLWPHISS